MLKINKQRRHGFKCQYSDRQRSMLLRYTQVNASIVIKQQNKNPCLGKHCLNSKGVEIREYLGKKEESVTGENANSKLYAALVKA